MASASINGRIIEIEKNETILKAAKRLSINIPTLCYSDRINPEGGCRMCLVACKGSPRPVAACHTSLAAGMTINTHTPELENLRREILKLYMLEDWHSPWAGDE